MIHFNKGKTLLCGLLALLFGGCADQEALPTEGADGTACTLNIAVEGSSTLNSRTPVVDPLDNGVGKQHVTRVQLYIYQSTQNGDFQCVANEAIPWKHVEGAMNGLNTREQTFMPKFKAFDPEAKYLFLAMGFDDTYTGTADNPKWQGLNSVLAFGEPDKITGVNTLLSDKDYFELKSGIQECKINHSELFAGSEIYTLSDIRSGAAAKRPIVLKRRVAGIAGYFRGVPKSINGKAVKKVELRLYTRQNRRIYFLPQYDANKYDDPSKVPDNQYEDYVDSGDKGGGKSVIATYELGANASPADKFTLSAYSLPITPSPNKGVSTLELVIKCENDKELTVRKIIYLSAVRKNTRSGTGIIDKPTTDGDNLAMHYPLRANNFYRIGSNSKPIDLSGGTGYIYVEIDPVWDEYYGGSLDDNTPNNGTTIDNEWGQHPGGNLIDSYPTPTPKP